MLVKFAAEEDVIVEEVSVEVAAEQLTVAFVIEEIVVVEVEVVVERFDVVVHAMKEIAVEVVAVLTVTVEIGEMVFEIVKIVGFASVLAVVATMVLV